MKSFSRANGRMFLVAVASLFAATVMGVEYVWTGEVGDGKWITPGNWVVSEENESGEVSWETPKTYPGQKDANGEYTDTVSFTNSVESIDLEGNSFYLADKGVNSGEQALRMESGISVKLTKGNIYVVLTDVTANEDIYTLGTSGSTNILEGVSFKGRTITGGTTNVKFCLQPNKDSTVIFEGNNTIDWIYHPKNAHTMIIRNGTTSISAQPANCGNGSVLWLTNAVLKYTVVNSYAIAKKIYFQDGEDRMAQIAHTKAMNANIAGEMNIIIPQNGRATPFVTCVQHGSGDASTKAKLGFVIDVTDWKKGGEKNKIPLIVFTGASQDAIMQTKMKYTTLKIVAQGESESVTKRRNARLEWDSSKNTLYYVQDKPYDGMKVIVR